MTKRTFVLFFCLLQVLATSLFSQSSEASINASYALHTPGISSSYDGIEEVCCDDETIIQADEFEWKENLSDLLRHRHSTYRFVSFAAIPSAFMDFVINSKYFYRSLISVCSYQRVAILPDYYSFLHRLCPF